MKRLTLLLVAMTLVGFGLFQLTLRENEPAEEPSENRVPQGDPLPFDTIVERKVIDEEAEEEGTGKLINRQVALEELPNRVLPAPRPREREVSAKTESGRTLDAMALDSWKHGDLDSWKHGDLVRALELFDEAVKADPDDALVRTDYGRMLTKMAAYDKAYPHLLRAAELEPDDPAVWLDLQTLYERDVLLEQADHAAKRAEALAGGRNIVQDEFGAWMLEGDRVIP